MSGLPILFAAIPPLAALALGLFGPRLGRAAGWFAALAALTAALVFSLFFLAPFPWPAGATRPFITFAGLEAAPAWRLDPLAGFALALLLVLNLLIQAQAALTASNLARPWRFFAAGQAAIGCAVLAILANDPLIMLAAWQGATLAAAVLARSRRDGRPAGIAGARLILTNLLGDAALLLGIFSLARFTGRLDFVSFAAKAPELAAIPSAIPGLDRLDATAVLLFIGLAVKTAQFPFHGWLDETTATAVPGAALIQTIILPLPALILLARLEPIFRFAPAARELVLGIAAFAACFAALVALAQTDLVKAIAWLVASRFGLIAAGLVAGAGEQALVLLGHHLIFAVILFLAADLVERALGGIVEMRNMGGLRHWLPFIFAVFLVGALGLVGPPLTPGFTAFVVIGGAVLEIAPVAGMLLVGAALATALAATRIMMTVFAGEERFARDVSAALRETPGALLPAFVMTALGAYVVVGLRSAAAPETLPAVSGALVVFLLTGFLAGLIRYRRRTPHSAPWKEFVRAECGWPATERRLIAVPFGALAIWSRDVVDRVGIASIATGLGLFARGFGESLLVLRSPRLSTALTILVLAVAVVVWSLVR